MGPPFEEDICDGFPERDPCGDGETLDEDLWCYAWRIGKMLCEPDRQGQEDQADDKEDDGATEHGSERVEFELAEVFVERADAVANAVHDGRVGAGGQ